MNAECADNFAAPIVYPSHLVLVVHSLRLQREVTAFALSRLRPQALALAIKPEELDAMCRLTNPLLVICDELTDSVVNNAESWVLLDNIRIGLSTVSIHNNVQCNVVTDLAVLVDAFDQSVRLRNVT